MYKKFPHFPLWQPRVSTTPQPKSTSETFRFDHAPGFTIQYSAERRRLGCVISRPGSIWLHLAIFVHVVVEILLGQILLNLTLSYSVIQHANLHSTAMAYLYRALIGGPIVGPPSKGNKSGRATPQSVPIQHSVVPLICLQENSNDSEFLRTKTLSGHESYSATF